MVRIILDASSGSAISPPDQPTTIPGAWDDYYVDPQGEVASTDVNGTESLGDKNAPNISAPSTLLTTDGDTTEDYFPGPSDRERKSSTHGRGRSILPPDYYSNVDDIKDSPMRCDKVKLQSSATVPIDINIAADQKHDGLETAAELQSDGIIENAAEATVIGEDREVSRHRPTASHQVKTNFPKLFPEDSDRVLQDRIRDLEQELTDLRLENRVLNTMLAYSASFSAHQQGVVQWLDTMYAEHQVEEVTELPSPIVPPEPPSTTWIRGSWLSVSDSFPELWDAEDLFKRGKYIDASFAVSKIILAKQYEGSDLLLNAKLLRAAIMRHNGDVRGSLYALEDTLDLASEYGLLHLSGKVHFHRAMTFLSLEEWAKSSWCFSLAIGAPGHEDQILANKAIADKNRSELAIDDPGKAIPHGFR